jgi:hypothetical protein
MPCTLSRKVNVVSYVPAVPNNVGFTLNLNRSLHRSFHASRLRQTRSSVEPWRALSCANINHNFVAVISLFRFFDSVSRVATAPPPPIIAMKLSVVSVLGGCLSIASSVSFSSSSSPSVAFGGRFRQSLFAVRGGGLFGGGNKADESK